MNGSMGYFICTVGIAGNPRNCSPVDPPRTIALDDMFLIIGALWGTMAVAFVVRLIAKSLANL